MKKTTRNHDMFDSIVKLTDEKEISYIIALGRAFAEIQYLRTHVGAPPSANIIQRDIYNGYESFTIPEDEFALLLRTGRNDKWYRIPIQYQELCKGFDITGSFYPEKPYMDESLMDQLKRGVDFHW